MRDCVRVCIILLPFLRFGQFPSIRICIIVSSAIFVFDLFYAAMCEAHGDPHYTTFDKKKYNFQGPCSYVFAEDCSGDKAFKVVTSNVKCGGRGATCTAAVTLFLNGDEIRLTRETQTVIINRIKIKKFPIKRPGQ